MLTVIAIIGILAAILIPTLGQVRKTAKYSTNVSTVRRWTIANMLHMQDNKGYVPWRGPAPSGGEAIIDSERFFPHRLPSFRGGMPCQNTLHGGINSEKGNNPDAIVRRLAPRHSTALLGSPPRRALALPAGA